MKEVLIKVYVHSALDYDKKPVYTCDEYKSDGKYDNKSFIKEFELNVAIPDNYDPIVAEVARLNTELAAANIRAHEIATDIQQKINDLLMLGYTA